MCRWFAYISYQEPVLLADILTRPENSIVKQVEEHYLPDLFPPGNPEENAENEAESKRRNKYFNNDGTGVAHYNKSQREYGDVDFRMPQVYKTIMAPGNDINFESLCENTTSRTVFAHVRKATSEVQQYNSHPFVFGRHIFMHNGSIAYFSQIRRALCAELSTEAYGNVKGTTDSEHLAALYFTYLAKEVGVGGGLAKQDTSNQDPGKKPRVEAWYKSYTLEQMRDSLKRAIAFVIQLQRDALGPNSTLPFQGSSLNLCTTDGEQLLAFRYRNVQSDKEQPPSLYYSTKAGVALNRKFPGHPNFLRGEDPGQQAAGLIGTKEIPAEKYADHIIIASEPTTKQKDDWVPIGKNQAVLVDNKTKFKIEDIEL